MERLIDLGIGIVTLLVTIEVIKMVFIQLGG